MVALGLTVTAPLVFPPVEKLVPLQELAPLAAQFTVNVVAGGGVVAAAVRVTTGAAGTLVLLALVPPIPVQVTV